MLTTLAHANFRAFVALLIVAAVMAALCAALEDDGALRWWYDQVFAMRRFFAIAGLLGLMSLSLGNDETVASVLSVFVAYGVDGWFALRRQKLNQR
jgi:hypothetical protein